jgi:hypothetical protein
MKQKENFFGQAAKDKKNNFNPIVLLSELLN